MQKLWDFLDIQHNFMNIDRFSYILLQIKNTLSHYSNKDNKHITSVFNIINIGYITIKIQLFNLNGILSGFVFF